MMIYSKQFWVIASTLLVILISGYFLLNRPLSEGTIIMTRIAADAELSHLKVLHPADFNYPSDIVFFNPNKPDKKPKVISKDFAVAHSPELSHDNSKMVFTGKLEMNSNRQIWVMNLKNNQYQSITDKSMNCYDPFFLPEDHIAFSCDWEHEDYGNGSFLFRMDPDKRELKRITFHPHTDRSGSMMHDGRILWVSEQVYPEKKRPNLMALRPDGTHSNLFYQLPEDFNIISKTRENNSGQIYYSASDNHTNHGVSLFRFSYINPVTSTREIYHSDNGWIKSIYPLQNGSILLSYQTDPSKPLGIFTYDEEDDILIPRISSNEYHYLEPVVVKGQSFKPKLLPSALNDEMDTGIIVFVEPAQKSTDLNSITHNRIQIEGLEGLYKEILTADDGSFYLKMPAKVPVRFSQVNESGEVMNGPYPWVWVMNGDRRGFTGWDPLQMISPPNLVPKAINDSAIQVSAPAPADYPFIVDVNRTTEVRDEN